MFHRPSNAQLALERQIVPVESGSVQVLAAVAADDMVLKKLVCPAKEISPLLRMVNFVAPLLEAVKMSPAPVLSVRRAAKLVEPETEAMAKVAL